MELSTFRIITTNYGIHTMNTLTLTDADCNVLLSVTINDLASTLTITDSAGTVSLNALLTELQNPVVDLTDAAPTAAVDDSTNAPA